MQRIVNAPNAKKYNNATSEALSGILSCFDGVVTLQFTVMQTSRQLLQKLLQEFILTYKSGKVMNKMDDIKAAKQMHADAVKRTRQFIDHVHATYPDNDEDDVWTWQICCKVGKRV